MREIKKQVLRNNEYYDTQEIYDNLYRKSKENYIFRDLVSIITCNKNIALAYRNIKNNKGSKTPGVNGTTIKDIDKYDIFKWCRIVNERFKEFKPMPVRRVEIEKIGGGIRPLGIPTIEDRMIQQCIKQVMEPIAEAKFYHGSYGFRPDRSTENAIAKVMHLINMCGLNYAIDIDIKGFFDNINHGKLLKQIWNFGIHDKKLISILSKMLKAEIDGIGTPTKGVPQGGVISTLLSNIVLNELDWWIHSQWEGMKTNKEFSTQQYKIRVLKKTKLKQMYIVRYADDFKILTDNYVSAQKIFIAVTKWLKERLNLDINKDKSMVINLRKNYSDFLGFKLKAIKKRKKYVVKSKISDKAKTKIISNYRKQIEIIKSAPNTYNVENLNSMILGWHNYYNIATNINLDFGEINFLVRKRLFNRTRRIRSDSLYRTSTYDRIYGTYNFKPISIAKITLYPLAGVKFKIPKLIKNIATRYTAQGRYYIHKNLNYEIREKIRYLIDNPLNNESIQKNDNRISLFVAQNGLCYISGQELEMNSMQLRNILPKEKGGTDKYSNLILVNNDVGEMLDSYDIEKYKESFRFDKKAIKRINKLRKLVEKSMI